MKLIRTLATLCLLFMISNGLVAQNWALINPAYKYNYSNDGTDTISNQVFVTHLDTLGVDSFRYEPVSYTHLRAHETVLDLVCRLLLEKKKNTQKKTNNNTHQT